MSFEQDGSNWGIYSQLFDANGAVPLHFMATGGTENNDTLIGSDGLTRSSDWAGMTFWLAATETILSTEAMVRTR
jgi:hypothetical protein